jgi:quercetin dioxygenase-like cupin family protein
MGKEEAMKVIKTAEVSNENVVSPLFTGYDVTRQILLPESQEFNINIVNFGKGVRNKFHTHDSEQVLIVTAGKDIAATEMEERVVSIGDVILFQAGEKHWHGATEDSEFSHLYVTRCGSETKFPV